jgi:hypothetical protein
MTVFRKKPPRTILVEMLKKVHHSLDNVPFMFTKDDFSNYEWGNELIELSPYYVPSMLERFIDKPNPITILRHILREHEFVCSSKEITRASKKTILYTVDHQSTNLTKEISIQFD